MTERVKRVLDDFLSAEYKKQRSKTTIIDNGRPENYPVFLYETELFERFLDAETPLIREDDIFGFNRTVKGIFYPNGTMRYKDNNNTVNYAYVLKSGFSGIRRDIMNYSGGNPNEFQKSVLSVLSLTLKFCERYREYAKSVGNEKLANVLERIPYAPATTFYEALVMHKILIFIMRGANYNHCTLGRFDRYMYPYYENDRKNGIPKEELFEMLELYFISINYDTDLYFGMQVGDNGQSMVLCGCDEEGNDITNELSYLCLDASEELCLIDPKINVRVNKNTPLEFYERCTRITAKGLGFPQYSNDDIIIPALVNIGTDLADARDYAVAACWEYTVTGKAMDIANWWAINFPDMTNRAIIEVLEKDGDFEEILKKTEENIKAHCDKLVRDDYGHFSPSPILSMMMDGCLECGKDISEYCTKYTNLGCQSAGLANAADALAAVKKTVYTDKTVTKSDLLNALSANFKDYSEIRNMLLDCPKMGNNDDDADGYGVWLMECFTKYLNGRPNRNGGVWRAGTGSAFYYSTLAKDFPATADGRYASEPFGCGYSPSVTAKTNGPLSVIQSFTKFDMTKSANGGPLTIEIHDSVFRNKEGFSKVASLVKTFVALGGHQLQLNSVNRQRLINAREHPESDPNLIVRVWGWSGYFCELDKDYQNHIILRTEYQC